MKKINKILLTSISSLVLFSCSLPNSSNMDGTSLSFSSYEPVNESELVTNFSAACDALKTKKSIGLDADLTLDFSFDEDIDTKGTYSKDKDSTSSLNVDAKVSDGQVVASLKNLDATTESSYQGYLKANGNVNADFETENLEVDLPDDISNKTLGVEAYLNGSNFYLDAINQDTTDLFSTYEVTLPLTGKTTYEMVDFASACDSLKTSFASLYTVDDTQDLFESLLMSFVKNNIDSHKDDFGVTYISFDLTKDEISGALSQYKTLASANLKDEELTYVTETIESYEEELKNLNLNTLNLSLSFDDSGFKTIGVDLDLDYTMKGKEIDEIEFTTSDITLVYDIDLTLNADFKYNDEVTFKAMPTK